MRVHRDLDDVPQSLGPSVVSIGKFDGVHVGHRAVISRVLAIAAEEGLASAVVTFDRHPLSVLAPEKSPAALLSLEQKIERLAATGVDAVVVLTFDAALAAKTPEEFVRSVLVDRLQARVVLVGRDFRFGARGAGDAEVLRELGRSHGFRVELVDDVIPDGAHRASSTLIRQLLTEGRIRDATALLGHPPTLRSRIVGGDRIGRELGYPTANLEPGMEGFIPADGVYAAWLTVDGTTYPAAVSIGNNPTFDGVPDKQVEAHVFDQQLDLYGRTVELTLVDYIRGMVKFAGVDELIAAMRRDDTDIRAVLARETPPGGAAAPA